MATQKRHPRIKKISWGYKTFTTLNSLEHEIFNRALVKSVLTEQSFSYFLTKTYVVGTQKNRLNETTLLSTKNTC